MRDPEKRNIIEGLHKAARKSYRCRKVVLNALDDQIHADLVEMISYALDDLR